MESKATHFINREGLTCPRTQVINREKFRNLQVQAMRTISVSSLNYSKDEESEHMRIDGIK